LPGVVYERLDGYRALTLDLYLPPATRSRPVSGYPLVVFIHGGGWLMGDRRRNLPFADFPSVLASLAARGYVVASIEYRLSGEATFPAQIRDVKAAIGWLRLHASDYGLDPKRAMTWGVSAGGHLAALVAANCGAAGLEAASGPGAPAALAGSDCVQGAVSWYGLYDFATLTEQARNGGSDISRDTPDAPEWRLLGCFQESCKDKARVASPVTYVGPRTPPMLLIVGSRDRLIPPEQTLEMGQRLRAAGVPHRLVVIPGAGHSLLGLTLDQTSAANLQALSETFRFIDETIGIKPRPHD
jgi:acetyl esterase/lipase